MLITTLFTCALACNDGTWTRNLLFAHWLDLSSIHCRQREDAILMQHTTEQANVILASNCQASKRLWVHVLLDPSFATFVSVVQYKTSFIAYVDRLPTEHVMKTASLGIFEMLFLITGSAIK